MSELIKKGLGWLDDYKNKDRVSVSRKPDYLMMIQKDEIEIEEEKKENEQEKLKNMNEKRILTKDMDQYKLTIPKLAEVSALKIFNDEQRVYEYLGNLTDGFFSSDNFQKFYLRDEARILWQFERTEELGDYLLLFPNPDCKEVKEGMNNGISYPEAQRIFNKVLDSYYMYPFKRQFMDSLRNGFEYAFLDLLEYVPPDKKKKKKGADADSEKDMLKGENEVENKNILEKKKSGDQKKGGTSKRKSVSSNAQQPKVEVRSAKEPQNNMDLDPIEEENSNQNEQEAEADFKISQSKLRKVWGGGLYSRPAEKPKEEQDEDLENNPEINKESRFYWKSDDSKTLDFLTLLRKTVTAVLANQGFVMREIFVNDGKNIALVLNMPEINLKKIAREMGLSKPVDFGFADLMSMEPVDSSNRPLRTNGYLLDENLWSLAYCGRGVVKKTKKFIKESHLSDSNGPTGKDLLGEDPEERKRLMKLRTDIIELLKGDCNFKKFVRLAGGVWKESTEDYLKEIYDHSKPGIKTWEMYRNYLIELAVRMNQVILTKKKVEVTLESYYEGGTEIKSTHNNVSRRRFDKMELVKFINRETNLSFTEALRSQKGGLKSLWERIGCNHIEYSFPYECSNNSMRPKNRQFYEVVWKDEIEAFRKPKKEDLDAIQEEEHEERPPIEDDIRDAVSGHMGISQISDVVYHYKFTKLERLKIIDYMVEKIVNITELANEFHKLKNQLTKSDIIGISSIKKINFLEDDYENIFFPLHNRSKLNGKDYSSIFSQIKESKSFLDKIVAKRKKAISQLEKKGPNHDRLSAHNININLDTQTLKSHFAPLSSKKPELNLIGVDGRSQVSNKMSVINMGGLAQLFKSKKKNPYADEAFEILKISYFKGKVLDNHNSFQFSILEKCRRLFQATKQGENPDLSKSDEEVKAAMEIYMRVLPKYDLDNKKLVNGVITALETSTTIRNFLPYAYTRRKIEDFQNEHDKMISYPLETAFKPPHWYNYFIGHRKVYPVETVRHYFGEKTALYFGFVAFYRDLLILPSILGLILCIILLVYRGGNELNKETDPNKILDSKGDWNWLIEKAYEWLSTFFAVYISIWSSYFLIKWVRYEKNFEVRFGQTDVEDKKTTRSSFRGQCKRDPVTDKMNNFFEDTPRLAKKQVYTILFTILWFVITFFSSFYILKYKREAYRNSWIGSNENSINANQVLFDLIEFLRIMLYQFIFFKAITKLIKLQNLKYMEDHESQLVLYLGLYQLFNNSAIIIIVMFQSLISRVAKQIGVIDENAVQGSLKSEELCMDDSCSEELTLFFATYCIFQAVWTLVFKLIILPILGKVEDFTSNLIKKAKKSISKKSDAEVKEVDLKAVKSRILEQIKNLFKEDDLDIYKKQRLKLDRLIQIHFTNPGFLYDSVNEEIDYQVTKLKDYKIGEDYDQLLLDYLELFNIFSYVTMFGVLFPLSFVGVSLMVFAEWRMDSRALIRQSRRPKPESASGIGIWKDMIQLVSFFAVCTNTYFVAFILFEKNNITWKFVLYIIMIVFLFVFIWLMYHMLDEESSSTTTIKNRVSYVKSLIFYSTEKKKAVGGVVLKRPIQITRNFKIFASDKLVNSAQAKKVQDIALDQNEELEERKKMNRGLLKMKQIHDANRGGIENIGGNDMNSVRPADVYQGIIDEEMG